MDKNKIKSGIVIAVFNDISEREVTEKLGFCTMLQPMDCSPPLLGRCDGIYISGKIGFSTDEIVKFAKEMGIVIFHSADELTNFPWKEQHSEFRKITNKMYHLHVKKNMDYSPANILGTGEIGVVVRMWDKMCRLMNLLGFEIEVKFKGFRETKEPKNESIEDSFLDSAVYAIIGLLYKRGKWGV